MIRFLIKILLMVVPVVCAILYYSTYVDSHTNGDLGRLGIIPFDDDYDQYFIDMSLSKSYETSIDNLDFEKEECDSTVLVIGDSFTRQGRAGFVNCVGALFPGYKILSYNNTDDEIIKYQLYINRLVQDKPLPRIVIMESIERHVTARLAALSMEFEPDFETILATSKADANTEVATDTVVTNIPAVTGDSATANGTEVATNTVEAASDSATSSNTEVANSPEEPGIFEKISNAIDLFISECDNKLEEAGVYKTTDEICQDKDNLKKIALNAQEYYKKHLDVIDNPVKHLTLKKDLFTCKGSENDLYFYNLDLLDEERDKCNAAIKNLEGLISLTEQKGIQFIFLIASDKYDLYRDFAKNNKYKAKGQMIHFSAFDNNNRFINCKKLLYPYIKKGEKDIYRCNDSHWSPIAAQYVAEEIKRKLDNQK